MSDHAHLAFHLGGLGSRNSRGGRCSRQAQQVTVGRPFHTLHDSFFENNSINWSGNYRGITFSYGGGALARPQFGLPDNSAGLTANFAFIGKDGQINFATNFSQGYGSRWSARRLRSR